MPAQPRTAERADRSEAPPRCRNIAASWTAPKASQGRRAIASGRPEWPCVTRVTMPTSRLPAKPSARAWTGARPNPPKAARAKPMGAQTKPQVSTLSNPGAAPRGHHFHAIRPVTAATGRAVRHPWAASAHTVRQRPRVHRQWRAGVADKGWCEYALHHARQSVGEWLLRKLQRLDKGRTAQRGNLLHPGRGTDPDRSLAAPLQHHQAA